VVENLPRKTRPTVGTPVLPLPQKEKRATGRFKDIWY
jgi:hypothetical protein